MRRMAQLIALGAALGFIAPVMADEPVSADGGTLYVHGVMRENTCRLEMDSAWQDVDLGDISRADVSLVGKMAKPVTVTLYLRDCPEIPTRSANITPLTHTRSAQQPGYQARFVAPTDALNPDLIKVTGVSGIGLRLKDSQGKTVKMAQQGDTVLLNPGQDTVTYTLQTERTTAALVPGPYHAVINFSMMYQ
ncbi:fimbrial protein [Cronobacter dublinensis]|uniref:fimbrial protein n=1 Tax=Cronobacter dublinensis TaxID=413497 RepID=UPI000CFB4207|nr:fimbrial protein [Cronobacter dublinensis]EGT4379661.1 type 1 fimbrial protein [Cronobacter dublinensis]EKM6455976.1 type 1 fimbrial protein [Cronobacter dublinensis]EKY3203870.1 type 1 fimbrial protein [Cronobacter dublinensis]EKY3223806.1 type 1 fimbrial protein [Cronobacter dublinensis]EKY3244254.1 type 1 fimbrial protein [Cronobacter dublinensis]